jgi:DNA-binding response OmpR family regulator
METDNKRPAACYALTVPLIETKMPLAPPIESAPYAFDAASGTVSLNGARVVLTPKEFDLGLYLFGRPGQACTREQLLAAVWGTSAAIETRTVDAHVSRLRRSLDLVSGRTGWRLVSVMKQGYRLERIDDADNPA